MRKSIVRLAVAVLVVSLSQIVSAAEVAPYFYTWGGSLTQTKQASGLNSATVAFAITRGTCLLDSSFTAMIPDIKNFINSGGSLITSFGGADGTYVEVACTDENQLFNLIDKVIQDTGSQRLDFDVEGYQLANTTATARRIRVLARIQAKYPNMYLSFTLPGWFNGLNIDSLNLIRSTIAGGVRINIVNVMAMDFGGDNVATLSPPTMANAVITTIQAAANQLKTIYSGQTTAQAYAMIGITPMIGTNDDGTTFTLADAAAVTQFAKQNGIGLLTFWAFQRDVAQSTAGLTPLNDYSGVVQSNYQFYNTFMGAATGAGTPTPPPDPVATAPSLSTCNFPNWVVNQQYAAGSIVKYTDGKFYIAKFENPGYNPTISTYYWAPYACSAVIASPTPAPTTADIVKVALASSSFLKSSLVREEVQTIQANLNSASGASDVIVQIQIRDSLRNIVQTQSYAHVNITAGVVTPFKFDYQVPSTLALGNYHIEVGVFSQNWVTYLYEVSATTFAVIASPTPAPTTADIVKVSLASSSFLKSSLVRGAVQTIQANLNSASGASDVIVQIQIRDSLRNIVQTQIYAHVNLAAGVATPFKFDYQVPSTLALGNYHIEVGVFSQSWVTYLYEISATTFAVTAPVLVCNYPNWVVYQQYAAGSIVRYSDGKFYRAKYANPGYNPTISTYYWAPYTCQP